MEAFEPKPLAHLKRDVRKMVEERLGCDLEHLPSQDLATIRREIVALRNHYRRPDGREWKYGRSRYRLAAYALAYYPYHVELVSEAIRGAHEDFSMLRKWDLTPERGHSGTTRYALIGCGAGPELYGLLRHLAGVLYSSGCRESVAPDISISLFEPEWEQWKDVAEAVTKPLIQRNPWIEEQREADRIRINWSPDLEPIPNLSLRGEYDFVLIQLVLNEVDLLWPTWLRGIMETHLAPGGMVCVIDMNKGVHDRLQEMGFGRARSLTLEWSEGGPRKFDPTTSTLLFSDADGEREKRFVNARASFWEKTAVLGKRRRPPRRTEGPGRVQAGSSPSRSADLFGPPHPRKV